MKKLLPQSCIATSVYHENTAIFPEDVDPGAISHDESGPETRSGIWHANAHSIVEKAIVIFRQSGLWLPVPLEKVQICRANSIHPLSRGTPLSRGAIQLGATAP
ncbi:hypothetical protein HPQ64_08605 [Rhizobiales bacterium]|uniref:hypothetical protein n=1 Tax=Hongsoonwoonella zoysiae TaxID=2821844 RepID=UPI00155FD7C7|nr:hypothetical protein [Hongsoonwoonella zoysiae]NRG17747.1 hypothetical protein [Hongsoonwoonella zoysiae]